MARVSFGFQTAKTAGKAKRSAKRENEMTNYGFG